MKKPLHQSMKYRGMIALAGALGVFQTYQNVELNQQIQVLEQKQQTTIHALQSETAEKKELEQKTQQLQTDIVDIRKQNQKKIQEKTDENTKLNEKNKALEESLRKLKLDLEEEKSKEVVAAKKVPTKKAPAEKAESVIHGTASAYTANCKGCTGITASGEKVTEGMVAMDDWVPLGTKVKITCESYPSINGTYTVQDRGGAIHGTRVDVFMPSHQKAIQFGKRQIKIEILN